MAADPKKLKSQLQNSQLALKDNPLFQLISQIIDALGALNTAVSGGGSGSGSTVVTNITNVGSGGIPGSPGEDGDDGITIPGPAGTQGAQGITGSQGPQGPVLFSEDGIDGDSGLSIPIPGPQGIQGIQGIAGLPTIIFPDAPDDPDIIIVQGPTGPIGTTGAQGPPGFALLDFGEEAEDGLMGPPGPAGVSNSSSFIQRVLVNITDAQLRALNTVPITILAAQGTGTIIVPIRAVLVVNILTTFSVSQTDTIRWAGSALGALAAASPIWNSTGKKMMWMISASPTLVVQLGTSNIENAAIEISGNVSMTGGSTNGGANVYLEYAVVVIP